MRSSRDEGFLKRIWKKILKFKEELKKESVASNPEKPVDCCNPPVYREREH